MSRQSPRDGRRPPEGPDQPAIALLGQTRDALEQLCESLGQPRYRGRQLAGWLYSRRARAFDAMTDLPADFRTCLAGAYRIGRGRLADLAESADGTRKLLLALHDGQTVETVLIPYDDRTSVCISSQTGCAVGCTFCATGYLGAGRNLSTGEITDQLLHALDLAGGRVSHVVFMGMGEPLLNLDAVLSAIRLWRDELRFSPRHVTVSTVGLPSGIERLAAAELPVTLALSLHAADDDLRRQLIPSTARRWSVAEVIAAARGYQQATGRRVTYEIVLLDRVNDRRPDAEALGLRLRPGEHVNLIPYNPVDEASYGRPDADRVARFGRWLEGHGLVVTQRQTRGDDIAGACGQLRAQSTRAEPR